MFILSNHNKIDYEAVIDAMLDNTKNKHYWLDSNAGSVVLESNSIKKTSGDKLKLEKDRYFLIPKINDFDRLSWMINYIQVVVEYEDKKLSVKLQKIVQGPNQYKNFIEALKMVGEDWLSGWDSWEGDNAFEEMKKWFGLLPIEIKEELDHFDNCSVCQAIKSGNNSAPALKNVFREANFNNVLAGIIQTPKTSIVDVKSACDSLLSKSYEEIWRRGEDYANQKRIKIIKNSDKFLEAIASGSQNYQVHLEFKGNGLSRHCSCPYIASHSPRAICKHMVATAIVWDELRGLARPGDEAVAEYTIAPALFSRSDIDDMYNDPLNVDLDMLRILSDETALGGRPRPHADLPLMPSFSDNQQEPLSLVELNKALKEIEGWSGRRNYDEYFCAGEMVAAFCGMLRVIDFRIAVTPKNIINKIMERLEVFNSKLIEELIDDSNGLHEFTEAHLENLKDSIKNYFLI
jgi:protein involved in ribonucleotide reduction